jgi:hypothetical protein
MRKRQWCTNYSDKQFLTWLKNRLVFIYGESENVDFCWRLQEIIDDLSEKPEQFEFFDYHAEYGSGD